MLTGRNESIERRFFDVNLSSYYRCPDINFNILPVITVSLKYWAFFLLLFQKNLSIFFVLKKELNFWMIWAIVCKSKPLFQSKLKP